MIWMTLFLIRWIAIFFISLLSNLKECKEIRLKLIHGARELETNIGIEKSLRV